MPVGFVVATQSDIENALRRLYEPRAAAGGETQADVSSDVGYEEDIQRLKDMAAEAPVIRFVNQLFQEAVEKRSSDIHLEPFHTSLRVRFRIDGLLREMDAPPQQLTSAILSRIKLLARLNIAERRLPQDGRIRTVIKGKTMDVRVSTVPTLYGEAVVMRLLDKSAVSFEFHDLGLYEEDLKRYLGILSNPNGIVLVTGPTGSGKTTTLYASLLHLNKLDTKILTVEDPVEYRASRHQSNPGQTTDRSWLCQCAWIARQAGSRHHPDRRNPRSRDGRDRKPVGADRAQGALDASHQ